MQLFKFSHSNSNINGSNSVISAHTSHPHLYSAFNNVECFKAMYFINSRTPVWETWPLVFTTLLALQRNKECGRKVLTHREQMNDP